MGHIRLGLIPKTQSWRHVVTAVMTNAVVSYSLVSTDASVGIGGGTTPTDAGATNAQRPGDDSAIAQGVVDPIAMALIAAKTLDAAEAGLERAVADEGLRHTFYLLTQVASASRSADWMRQLRAVGIDVSETSSLLDLTGAFQIAVEDYLADIGKSTDIAEIAQRSAGEALCTLAIDRAHTLFGDQGNELRHAIRPLSTAAGFGALGQAFFGTFLTHYLNFYLSRITASEIGRGVIQDIEDITRFNAALALHCEQSAGIVRDFAGKWYSKTQYLHGITPKRATGFVAIAVKKLQAELRMQQAGK